MNSGAIFYFCKQVQNLLSIFRQWLLGSALGSRRMITALETGFKDKATWKSGSLRSVVLCRKSHMSRDQLKNVTSACVKFTLLLILNFFTHEDELQIFSRITLLILPLNTCMRGCEDVVIYSSSLVRMLEIINKYFY